jgi:4,5-DOPA dioxygenase extradiol
MDWRRPDTVFDWADRFNSRVRQALLGGDHAALVTLVSGPGASEDARLAVPTLEHYLPMLYVAAQRGEGEPIELFNDHIEYGSIGMMSYRVG